MINPPAPATGQQVTLANGPFAAAAANPVAITNGSIRVTMLSPDDEIVKMKAQLASAVATLQATISALSSKASEEANSSLMHSARAHFYSNEANKETGIANMHGTRFASIQQQILDCTTQISHFQALSEQLRRPATDRVTS